MRCLAPLFVFVVALLPSSGRAGELAAWRAGINARTELGTHPVRFGAAIELSRFEISAVVDPMFWTDGQVDTDLWLATAVTSSGVAAAIGWRATTLPLVESRQWQHKVLIGGLAPIASLSTSWLETRVGAELATVLVKHGGGVPSDWISFAEPGGYLDLVNLALFVRFDYAR